MKKVRRIVNMSICLPVYLELVVFAYEDEESDGATQKNWEVESIRRAEASLTSPRGVEEAMTDSDVAFLEELAGAAKDLP